MELKFLLIFNLCTLFHFVSMSNVSSDKKFPKKPPISTLLIRSEGTPAVTDLQDLSTRLNEIHTDLQKIKLSMFLNQNRDNMEMKILKCATELSRNNEENAIKYWEDLHIYLAPHEEARNIASRLINRLNLSRQQSALPIINFVEYMNVPQAYDHLQRKLKETGNFYGNHHVFLLAENIRRSCGTMQSAFTSLPQIVQDISSSVIVLKNKWTNGYLYYESNPENFFTWFSAHKYKNNLDDLSEENKGRAEWQFNLVGDKIQIVNIMKGDVFTRPEMEFLLELVNDHEIRLKVDQAEDSRLIGKYLVGKGRNRGEQFSLVAFQNITVAQKDHVIWKAEAVYLKTDHLTINNNIQLC